MAKKVRVKTAKRRKRRVRLTPRLFNAVKASILKAGKIVYKDLTAEHGISVGTVAKVLAKLEEKGVVGPGGKGKTRAILQNADGSPRSDAPAADTAPARRARQTRGRRKPDSGAPSSQPEVTILIAEKLALLENLQSLASGRKRQVLEAIESDVSERTRQDALSHVLND